MGRNGHGMLLQLLAGHITPLLPVLYCYQLHGEKPSIPGLGELGRRIPKETGYVIYRVNIQISIEAFAIPVSIRAIFQPEITEKDPEFRDFPTASTGFCQLCQADILRAGLWGSG